LERRRELYAANPTPHLDRAAKQRALRDPAEFREYMKQWHEKNPGANAEMCMTRHTRKLQRTPKWADTKAIAEFYANCPPGMEVDHIIPMRGRLVSGLHVANNLQYLSKTENNRKKNKFDPWTFQP